MNIHFISVHLHNFGSWGDLDFDFMEGRHLILGLNGAGKTRILRAITACFFRTYIKKDPSFMWQGDCNVTVVFRLGEDVFSVTRGWDHGSRKNELVKSLVIRKNDVDITSRKLTDAEIQLGNIIPYTESLFISTVIVAQNLPINFCAMSSGMKKSIIEELIGRIDWGSFLKRLKKFSKKESDTYLNLNRAYGIKHQELVALNARIQTLKEVKDDDSLEVAREKDLVQTEAELGSLLEEIESLKSSLPKIEFVDSQNIDKQVYSRALAEAQSKLRDLAKTLSTKVCYACDRPYPEEDMTHAEQRKKLFEQRVKKLQPIISGIESELNSYYKQQSQISSKSKNAEYLERAVLDLKKPLPKRQTVDLAQLESQLDDLGDGVRTAYDELLQKKTKLEHLDFLSGLLTPSSKFRSEVLNNYLGFLNTLINKIMPMIAPGYSAELSLRQVKSNGVELSIKREGIEVSYEEDLSGGQKRRLDIAMIFSFQRFLQLTSDVKSNLIAFDEIFTGLDSDGVSDVLTCLGEIFPESNSIYVITHRTNVSEHFDNVIGVTSEGFGKPSEISYSEGYYVL